MILLLDPLRNREIIIAYSIKEKYVTEEKNFLLLFSEVDREENSKKTTTDQLASYQTYLKDLSVVDFDILASSLILFFQNFNAVLENLTVHNTDSS